MRQKSPRNVSQSINTQPNGDATVAETNVCYLSVEQLALSPTNARITSATEAEDAELEASIRAKGILQNLIVHRQTTTGSIWLMPAAAASRSCKSSPPKA